MTRLDELVASLRADPPGDPRVRELLELVGSPGTGVVDFVVNVSHELRTPLNAIIGYSELLEEELGDRDPGLLPDVARIRSAGAHVLELVNDLLDLSKLEAGKLKLQPEPVLARDAAEDAALTVDPLVSRRGNRLVLDVTDEVGAVFADPMRLRQCLLNLLSNANKFTEDGTVTLRAAREAEAVAFTVADTGCGMSRDAVSRLFRRFEQASDDTARKHGGTGLGLALTRELVVRMGGSIEVDSELGRGTLFVVRLPGAPA